MFVNMRQLLTSLILFLLSLTLAAQEHFTNPLFPGDYPDPSILVDGEDFYMVHSSFEYYPGLTIWHSRDLANWTPVTSALTKYVGSVWAPDLVKSDGKYYIYFPASNTNYVIVAPSIEGSWSDPVELKISHIDPGHVEDGMGNRYLYFSSGGYVPLAQDGLSVTGPLQHVYDGWPIPPEWVIECFCMESPKLFKRGDYYYLTVAQGGTAGPATGHMVISARSRSPLGPWENSPYNPIIRAETNQEKWCSVGHATIFEASPENWWMVFHGYENGHYNRGRQTLMAPVEWTADGWYRIPESVDLEQPIKRPLPSAGPVEYCLDDTFEESRLKTQWKFFGQYDPARFSLPGSESHQCQQNEPCTDIQSCTETHTGAGLIIKGKGHSVAESSPLLCIPAHNSYSARVEMEIEGDAIGGLMLFYSQKIFSGILADKSDILANLRGWQFPTQVDVIRRRVFLRLDNLDDVVNMYYSTDGEQWVKIENSADVSAYHHNVLSEFLSLRIGLVSMGDGLVRFRNFKYDKLE